ncbi:MAG: radical SAM/SPASM domain-containing protein [Bacteroidales bacterium]|jgi:radical SAM protein with 4Fe4S-binding SPASM domain|nr:radical SAM/SPASM domain-containing protein [Bacteroidales bacterium]
MIFTYLSIRKLLNIILVWISYLLSLITKKVIVFGYPYAVSIETSAICNLKCPECPTGNKSLKRKQGVMSYSDFEDIIDQIKNYAVYVNLSLQGEPFLNKELLKMIQLADKNNILTSLSTNGHFLNYDTALEIIDSGLKRLIVSLDGTDQETYEKYRKGGSFNSVIDGIKILSSIKAKKQVKYPEIVLQFIVFNHNEHQLNKIKELGKNLGVNKVELKSAQITNPESINSIPSINKFSRYTIKNNKLKLKSNQKNRCFRIWETIVITWDGTIIPCCFDKDANYSLGNMKINNIFDVWKSLAFNNFRKNILADRKKTAICCNCTEGLRIKY